jgi:hypothetical protein
MCGVQRIFRHWTERNDQGLIKLLSNDNLPFRALTGPFVSVLLDVSVQ